MQSYHLRLLLVAVQVLKHTLWTQTVKLYSQNGEIAHIKYVFLVLKAFMLKHIYLHFYQVHMNANGHLQVYAAPDISYYYFLDLILCFAGHCLGDHRMP